MLKNHSSDNMYGLIHRILKEGEGATFYTFSNADGKQWIMPKQNMRTAINLYQPSGIKGKAMKFFFPYLHTIATVRSRLGVITDRYTLKKELKELLSSLYCNNDIEFALFGGTPSAHQKITIQISLGKTILGYCKITDKNEIKQIFLREQKLLNTLQNKGVKHIPTCLFCDELTDDIAIFVQSTVKSNHSIIKHKWTNEHWEFLTHLYNQTKQTLTFRETDFAKNLTTLFDQLKYVSPIEAENLSKAIAKVKYYYSDQLVEFSVYHADFTPWNIFFEQKKLFVFDFEYAQMSYPPFLDRFHYFTQCCIFEKKWSAEQIFETYQTCKRDFKRYFANPDMSYTCYLLAVISFYLDRDGNECANEKNSNLKTWISLIIKLNNR